MGAFTIEGLPPGTLAGDRVFDSRALKAYFPKKDLHESKIILLTGVVLCHDGTCPGGDPQGGGRSQRPGDQQFDSAPRVK